MNLYLIYYNLDGLLKTYLYEEWEDRDEAEDSIRRLEGFNPNLEFPTYSVSASSSKEAIDKALSKGFTYMPNKYAVVSGFRYISVQPNRK